MIVVGVTVADGDGLPVYKRRSRVGEEPAIPRVAQNPRAPFMAGFLKILPKQSKNVSPLSGFQAPWIRRRVQTFLTRLFLNMRGATLIVQICPDPFLPAVEEIGAGFRIVLQVLEEKAAALFIVEFDKDYRRIVFPAETRIGIAVIQHQFRSASKAFAFPFPSAVEHQSMNIPKGKVCFPAVFPGIEIEGENNVLSVDAAQFHLIKQAIPAVEELGGGFQVLPGPFHDPEIDAVHPEKVVALAVHCFREPTGVFVEGLSIPDGPVGFLQIAGIALKTKRGGGAFESGGAVGVDFQTSGFPGRSVVRIQEGEVQISLVGASALNQAIKACIVARRFLKDDETPCDIIIQPEFLMQNFSEPSSEATREVTTIMLHIRKTDFDPAHAVSTEANNHTAA